MSGATRSTEEHFRGGLWGWAGVAWRKLSMLWGFTATYHESKYTNEGGEGIVELDGSTVPTGEVWIVENAYMFNGTTPTGTCTLFLVVGSDFFPIKSTAYETTTRLLVYTGRITVGAGEHLTASFELCKAGDELYAYFNGHKMKVG